MEFGTREKREGHAVDRREHNDRSENKQGRNREQLVAHPFLDLTFYLMLIK